MGLDEEATIGQYGCLLTSFSMVAGYFKHDATPDVLNSIFTTNGVYVAGDLLTDWALQTVFGDCKHVGSLDYGNLPADMRRLRQLSANLKLAVILELDYDHDPNDGIQTHFVVLVGYNGDTFHIADPWTGTVVEFKDVYGKTPEKTLQKFIIYR